MSPTKSEESLPETAEGEDEARLSLVFESLGLEDSVVLEPRTLTIGVGTDHFRNEPSQLIARFSDVMVSGLPTSADLKIKEVLGEGGMGLVELAQQLSLGRDVAVKKVRPGSRSEEATLELLREGWTTGLLEHPNIVPVHSLGQDADGQPLIVMKKISGITWLEIIKDLQKAPEGFTFEDKLDLHVEVLSQVCNAVHYAHSQGIIHRDLKPENVMLGEFGEVYVLDWGLAVSLDEQPHGRLVCARDVRVPAGTPAYMAPEMVEGFGEKLGVHTDVFLLGAMLYEALMGHPPYTGCAVFGIMYKAYKCVPPVFGAEVPPELAEICHRAMSREPWQRYESARAMRDALMAYRHNRESHRLAALGQARLEELKDLIEQEAAAGEVDEIGLHNVFSKCRFAFEQARQINAGHHRARKGLQIALEVMIERELGRQAHTTAARLLADLPEENPELESRLAELEQRLQSEEAALQDLHRFRREADVEVGRESRTRFIMFTGIAWCALALIVSFFVEVLGFETTHPRTFAHIAILTAGIATVVFLGRERFFENLASRRILYALLVGMTSVTVHRGISWIQDVPFRTAAASEMLMYGMGILIVGVVLDRRLIWSSAPFFACSIIGAIWPASMYWLFGPANLLAVVAMLWAWRCGEDEAGVDAVDGLR